MAATTAIQQAREFSLWQIASTPAPCAVLQKSSLKQPMLSQVLTPLARHWSVLRRCWDKLSSNRPVGKSSRISDNHLPIEVVAVTSQTALKASDSAIPARRHIKPISTQVTCKSRIGHKAGFEAVTALLAAHLYKDKGKGIKTACRRLYSAATALQQHCNTAGREAEAISQKKRFRLYVCARVPYPRNAR
jgi:hypothetical protein